MAENKQNLNINASSSILDGINQLAAELEKTELFRGITYAIYKGQTFSIRNPLPYPMENSKMVFNALKAMVHEKKGTFPIMWGFRHYTPDEPLTEKEIHTLRAYARMFDGLRKLGIDVETPLILADIHAEHNGIFPDGPEGYREYYLKVQEEADKLGIPSVWLSDILIKLNLTPHKIAQHGETLIRKRTDLDEALESPQADIPGTPENKLKTLAYTPGTKEYQERQVPTLTNEEAACFKNQAKHMASRYPKTHADVLSQSDRRKNEIFSARGIKYAQFRRSESVLVLPYLNRFFNTKGVLLVHVADPKSGRNIGIIGLCIFSKDANNQNVANIPWKGDDVVQKEQHRKAAHGRPASNA